MLWVFRLLCVLAGLGAMDCSSSPQIPNCPDGGYCTLLNGLPWTSGSYTCTPAPIRCNCSMACNGPDPCPLTCPDAGTQNVCPQGLVCAADETRYCQPPTLLRPVIFRLPCRSCSSSRMRDALTRLIKRSISRGRSNAALVCREVMKLELRQRPAFGWNMTARRSAVPPRRRRLRARIAPRPVEETTGPSS